jgi:hypothetical protein
MTDPGMLQEFLAGGQVDAAAFALRPDYGALPLAARLTDEEQVHRLAGIAHGTDALPAGAWLGYLTGQCRALLAARTGPASDQAAAVA